MPKMEKKIRSLNIKINKYSRIIQRVALITTYQFLNKLKIPKGVKRIKIIKGTYNPKTEVLGEKITVNFDQNNKEIL